MPEEDDRPRQVEFWEEEARKEHTELRKHAVRLGLAFAGLCAGVIFAVWWASSALHFSSSRVTQSTPPTYKVSGTVREASSGAPVPWAEIADDPAGQPPLFHTTADRYGAFELLTIAEPHQIRVSAFGYKPKTLRVGKAWFRWMPSGSEQLDVTLQPE
jgi:hypothetical protein